MELKPDSNLIIFSGTSLTENFELQPIFDNPEIINLGFGGNTFPFILRQAAKYLKRHPKKVFLEAGINDLRNYSNIESCYINFVRLCELTKTVTPNTSLYVQSVFPTNQQKLNESIIFYNKLVKSYCVGRKIIFIDLYSLFTRNGFLDESLSTDGIHFNEKGYLLWKKGIAKYISQ